MGEIVLECKPDEALMMALGYPRRRIVHQNSRGEVINYLQKNPSNIVGIIDDDPGSAKPTYFSRFIRETEEKFFTESFLISSTNTRLVIIKPQLETWILRQAIDHRVDVAKYHLPSSTKKLHEVINSKLPRFINLIEDMLEIKCNGLLHLKDLVGR